MEDMFNSRARVWRQEGSGEDGAIGYDTNPVFGLDAVDGRLDLFYQRPGKDLLPALQSGVSQDRMGIWFCSPDWPIQDGDILQMIPDDEGVTVIQGNFEIKVMPDIANGYSYPHHIEVQVQETKVKLRALPIPTPTDAGAP